MRRPRLDRWLAWSLSLLGAALVVGWVPAPQSGGGTVVGEVVNGTPGAGLPETLGVTLHTFEDMAETGTYTTTVTGEGVFRFDAVPYEEGETVVARVVYGGVTYVSDFATIGPDQDVLSLPVTIYETTQEPGDILVAQLHVFVNPVGQLIEVGEYAVVGNTGSQTYVGIDNAGVRTTWTAQLPEGTGNLQFEGAELGGRFVSVPDGFADTRPIPPGQAGVETSFSYQIPLREGVEIAQVFDIPVRSVVVVLPEGSWGLKGPGISSESTLDTQTGAALSYAAGPLRAGEPLAFRIVPRTSRGPDASGQGSSSGMVVGFAALVVAALAVFLMWRSASARPVPAEARADVEAIVALDREFEGGSVSEAVYREKRRALKRRVREAVSDQNQ